MWLLRTQDNNLCKEHTLCWAVRAHRPTRGPVKCLKHTSIPCPNLTFKNQTTHFELQKQRARGCVWTEYLRYAASSLLQILTNCWISALYADYKCYIHTYTFVYLLHAICKNKCVCVCVYIHIYIYVFVYVCIQVRVWVSMCLHMIYAIIIQNSISNYIW